MDRLALSIGLLSLLLSSACMVSVTESMDDSAGIEVPETGEPDDEARCDSVDALEPNEQPEVASRLGWGARTMSEDQTLQEATLQHAASLCAGDHDWYLIPVAELGFDSHVVRIDGLVRGASWCGHVGGCNGEVLPDAAENTLAIEVYDASERVLLGSDIATNGRVDVDGWGPSFANDLLIHVYVPSSAAVFDYDLHVDVRNYDAEDECEC